MPINVDYYFFYKYLIRFINIHKLNIFTNTYSVIFLKKIIMHFFVINLEDLDNIQSYNYIYFFKFFFGRKAYLTKLKSRFSLGIWKHSYVLLISFNKKDIYTHLFFILNDFLPEIDKTKYLIQKSLHSFNMFHLIIKELNMYGEIKSNMGLFFLKSFLNVKFFCTGFDLSCVTILLNSLKINL